MYRVVFNDQSGRYRVERKGWLGWGFVQDESGDYLGFETLEQARAWVRENKQCQGTTGPRRWRVVDCCGG
jgi:hypothetical protein